MERKKSTIIFCQETFIDNENPITVPCIKFCNNFKEKQLKELKGAPLSVFICYGLNSDNEGYSFIDDDIIKKQTGFSTATDIRARLIKNKLLYQERLRDKKNHVKKYIHRILQPVEEGKRFIINGEEYFTPVYKLIPDTTLDINRGHQEKNIIEEKKIEENKVEKELKERIKNLIRFYYGIVIKDKGFKPEISGADVTRLKQLLIRQDDPLNEDKIKQRIKWYLGSEKCKEINDVSLKTALSVHSLNKYNIENKRDSLMYSQNACR